MWTVWAVYREKLEVNYKAQIMFCLSFSFHLLPLVSRQLLLVIGTHNFSRFVFTYSSVQQYG